MFGPGSEYDSEEVDKYVLKSGKHFVYSTKLLRFRRKQFNFTLGIKHLADTLRIIVKFQSLRPR